MRLAIDCLPAHTREAMLEGIRENPIIVGAYTDRDGGICPMLAAHRSGGRTDFLGFARAWDRFTDAPSGARRATRRELGILVAHLEASLLAEADSPAPPVDLGEAIRDHRSILRARPAPESDRSRSRVRPRPGDRSRTRELRLHGGWAWLRPFRRLDDYTRALERVEAQLEATAGAEGVESVEREPVLR